MQTYRREPRIMPRKRRRSRSKRPVPQRTDPVHLDPPPQNLPPRLALCLQRRLKSVDGREDHAKGGGGEGGEDGF